MLEEARALVDEVLQEIPDLTSSEGSWEESESELVVERKGK